MGVGGGGGGSGPETLFDNHPTLVQIGTLASNLTSTVTSLTLAALPTETVAITDFLLIESEVIDLSVSERGGPIRTKGPAGNAWGGSPCRHSCLSVDNY